MKWVLRAGSSAKLWKMSAIVLKGVANRRKYSLIVAPGALDVQGIQIVPTSFRGRSFRALQRSINVTPRGGICICVRSMCIYLQVDSQAHYSGCRSFDMLIISL